MHPLCIPAAAFCLAVTASPDVTFCAPHKELAAMLKQNWHEEQVGAGINFRGILVGLFSSPDGVTWTLTFTRPNGESCVITAGRDWRSVPLTLPEAKRRLTLRHFRSSACLDTP